MVRRWEPGTQYNYDDVVEYQGSKYKIIQPHRSQSDWTPPVTPALWGKLSDDYGHDDKGHHGHHQGGHQGGYQPQPQPPQQQWQQPSQQHHGGGDKSDSDDEGKKKDDKLFGIDKDTLKVGGALLGGAALLGGGFAAYKHHQGNKEEKANTAWAQSNWLQDAQARTAAYYQQGPRGPVTWVLTRGKQIPQNAILVGPERSWNLYICRAYLDGGVQLGKASDAFKKGGVLGYKRDEVHVEEYEVLVGDINALRWVPVSGRLNVNNLGYRPVEGGRENDGTPLYIAQAPYNGAVHPGKASEKLDGAFIPYDGTEKQVREYRVLCYN
ncbi:hypothetical protein AX16_001879 [Volvariella volvacea WC 439]|nr:hypothetical protein AX16_001879 [Volvariella volvacea WC 439]